MGCKSEGERKKWMGGRDGEEGDGGWERGRTEGWMEEKESKRGRNG